MPSVPSLEGGFNRSLSVEPPKIAEDGQESSELFIHMLDSQLPYGYEFYGCDVSLALTPMTERCFLTLTQVMHHLFCPQNFGGSQKFKQQEGILSPSRAWNVCLSHSMYIPSFTKAQIV